jgi:hypothetical protein
MPPASTRLLAIGANINLATNETALCRIGENVAGAGDLADLESQLKPEKKAG